MFLDLPVQYTSPVVKNNDTVIEKFIIKNKNVVEYSSNVIDSKLIFSTTYTKSIRVGQNRIPAPSSLKKAMFKMSSKGINTILSKS